MVFCSVVGCSNRSDSSRRKKKPTNTNFFRIPRIVVNRCERSKTLSTNRRTLWLARIIRADLDPQNPNLRVCGAHFVTGTPSDFFDSMNPDWPRHCISATALGKQMRIATSAASYDSREKRAIRKQFTAYRERSGLTGKALVGTDRTDGQPRNEEWVASMDAGA
ncbi:hypothetical protein HPB49_008260 [Dermacentor silvarum]|uniref:Uncharacterized protein n=1 Tax=Dermacentor silvarum TaxID=543639 RepID=A0ACB8DXF7_DERSI|nr:hypothetical protein HPB49_008260 [Dermacentor silvarum]